MVDPSSLWQADEGEFGWEVSKLGGLMFVAMSIALVIIAYRLVRKVPEAHSSLPSADAPGPVQMLQMAPKHLVESKESKAASNSDEKHWAAALAEFDGPSRRPGLWALSFSEAHGNEASAKAAYLQRRVAELREAPPAFITKLREVGYKVEHNDSRWNVIGPNGGITRHFNSIPELEAQVPFLVQHVASIDASQVTPPK